MLPRVLGCRPGGTAVGGTNPSPLGEVVEELEDLPQTVQVEQVFDRRRRGVLGNGRGVGAAQGDGGMSAIREPDDEVRVTASAQANHLDALAAEGVMGMGDRDESRRRWG
jgi:hypothetical protein